MWEAIQALFLFVKIEGEEMKKEAWFLLVAVCFVVACAAVKLTEPTPNMTQTVTGTSVSTSTSTGTSCASGTWCYDSIVSPMVTNALMLADVSSVCKSAPIDRRRLWTHIVQAISYAESDWKYESTYQESFIDDYTHKLAVSIGLLQLSVSDVQKKTPYCLKATDASLKTPLVNLGCGVEIMNWLTTRSGAKHSIVDLQAYWSVTRPQIFSKKLNAYIHNSNYDKMVNKLRELEPGC